MRRPKVGRKTGLQPHPDHQPVRAWRVTERMTRLTPGRRRRRAPAQRFRRRRVPVKTRHPNRVEMNRLLLKAMQRLSQKKRLLRPRRVLRSKPPVVRVNLPLLRNRWRTTMHWFPATLRKYPQQQNHLRPSYEDLLLNNVGRRRTEWPLRHRATRKTNQPRKNRFRRGRLRLETRIARSSWR